MWVLKFLPDWIFYATFFAGVIGIVATQFFKFIPFVFIYRTPIQLTSTVLIAIGTYMSGAVANENAWLMKVKELEVKLAQAQAESQKENVKIVEKVINKITVVKQRGDDIVQYVDREVVKYDVKCEIPQEFKQAHDRAAEHVK